MERVKHKPYGPYEKYFKRPLDLLCGLLAVAVFWWLYLILIILGAIFMGGNPFFTQERPGKDEKIFKLIKFRTMDNRKDRDGNLLPDEQRLTKFGKILRSTSLDELPELINILKGDMSVVGPRPERPQFVEKFKEEIPRYMIKHQVRPGLTGWAQVNGYRGNTSIRKRIEYDLYYIENWTIGLDVKILILTFFKGFVNKNAY